MIVYYKENMIMSDLLVTLQKTLLKLAQESDYNPLIFFKQEKGSYAEHDKFLGIRNPILRKLAQEYSALDLKDTSTLLQSEYNESRLLALFLMVDRYQKGDQLLKNKIYQLYLENIDYVNNWNLVDSSAHYILGNHIYNQYADQTMLFQLIDSDNLWHRRIAMISSWYYIRNDNFELTFNFAQKLLLDKHDLIHKAVGWMLREVGKRNREELELFLNKYAPSMPRTMLRYAIEHFDKTERMNYLKMK